MNVRQKASFRKFIRYRMLFMLEFFKLRHVRRHCVIALLASVVVSLPGAYAAPGDVDPLDLNIVGSDVLVSAVQPDGKTIIAGNFGSVLGQARNNIARLNANGTLDAGFNPNVNGGVYSVTVQADGQILLGGIFTTVAGTPRNNIARVAANGTLDSGFNPKVNVNGGVYSVEIQADGQILLGGSFTTVAGTTRNNMARVAANGTLDAGFNPDVNGFVNGVAVQADGQILLGGGFTTVAGTPRNRIARLAVNGTLDAGFNPNVNGVVRSVAVQVDGQILLGGQFTTVTGTPRNYIARVAANSTLDADFDPNVNGPVVSVAVQADGQILLGGIFTTVAGASRNRIARVAANGTLDAGFNPNVSTSVYSVALQADGQILLGGQFTTVAGTPRKLFARLINDPAAQSLSAVSATQVLWSRGGSTPDVIQTTFELSIDGGSSYTPLGGTATRVDSTANWQLSGLSLPASGQLRALGRTSGGHFNGSSSMVQQVASFSLAGITLTVTPSCVPPIGGAHTVFWKSTGFVNCTGPASDCSVSTWSQTNGLTTSGSLPLLTCQNAPIPGTYPLIISCTDVRGQSQSQSTQLTISNNCAPGEFRNGFEGN